jgi:hypothetical protein
MGDLSWFRAENAPAGSTARCMDGCAVERDCPYSAVKLYLEKEGWSYVFDLPEDKERDAINKLLSANPEVTARLARILAQTQSADKAMTVIGKDPALIEQLAAIFGPDWQRRLENFADSNNPRRLAAKKELLATTNYGRCVYRMDNDQPDRYVTNLRFAGGTTASFSMEAFTSYHGRRTRIMGSMGDIVGDMSKMTHSDFRTGKKTNWKPPVAGSGHGGGDFGLVFEWVKAVSTGDKGQLSSTIDDSIESHAMAFAAERSRLQGSVEAVHGDG